MYARKVNKSLSGASESSLPAILCLPNIKALILRTQWLSKIQHKTLRCAVRCARFEDGKIEFRFSFWAVGRVWKVCHAECSREAWQDIILACLKFDISMMSLPSLPASKTNTIKARKWVFGRWTFSTFSSRVLYSIIRTGSALRRMPKKYNLQLGMIWRCSFCFPASFSVIKSLGRFDIFWMACCFVIISCVDLVFLLNHLGRERRGLKSNSRSMAFKFPGTREGGIQIKTNLFRRLWRHSSTWAHCLVRSSSRPVRRKAVSTLMTCHNCFAFLSASLLFAILFSRQIMLDEEETLEWRKNCVKLAKCDLKKKSWNVGSAWLRNARRALEQQRKRKYQLNLNNYF